VRRSARLAIDALASRRSTCGSFRIPGHAFVAHFRATVSQLLAGGP